MNELRHLAEFKEVLSNYKISPKDKQSLLQNKLVLLTAPTSSGRNTIIRELVKTNEYHFIVSDTTRQPRVNDGVMEQNGEQYWFRTEEEVLHDLKAGKYIEAAIIHGQQVSGARIEEIKRASDGNKIAITEIDNQGAHTIVQLKPDTIAIFVLPPSFEEWQLRIKHRGKMDLVERRRRMHSAQAELAAALSEPYYKFVINDTIEHAMEQIHAIAKLGKVDAQLQQECRNIAEQLSIGTSTYLNSLK